MQYWFYLMAAIVFEVAGTTSMKLSNGFTRIVPSVLMFVCYAATFTLLTFALKKFDMSFVYAIWAGVGTALITIVGVLYFREPATALKFASILAIIAGVVGLNLARGVH